MIRNSVERKLRGENRGKALFDVQNSVLLFVPVDFPHGSISHDFWLDFSIGPIFSPFLAANLRPSLICVDYR